MALQGSASKPRPCPPVSPKQYAGRSEHWVNLSLPFITCCTIFERSFYLYESLSVFVFEIRPKTETIGGIGTASDTMTRLGQELAFRELSGSGDAAGIVMADIGDHRRWKALKLG